MKKRQITIEEFLSYTPIKPGVVHIHQGLVYKHAPNSLEIANAINDAKADPVFKYITVPKSVLFLDDIYFGYTTKFQSNLHIVEDAEYLGIITDINEYIWKLIQIIEKLNKLNMCYWDFHRNNIYSDNKGNPFILDIDDIRVNPTDLHLYHQIKYLTEYLLNLYLGQEKTIIHFLKNDDFRAHISKGTIAYLESLIKRTGTTIEFPHKVIDELSNPYKRELIKSKIK